MIEYLIIFTVSIILFWRSIYCGLVVDDVTMHPLAQEYKNLFKDKKIKFPELLWNILQGGGLFKNVKLDHAFSILIHFINACLILKISALLPAALLYLCNPINNQVSLWLNGRRFAITIFCCLASWAFWPSAIVLYPFAIWLHTSGAMFPFLFLATPLWGAVPVGAIACYFIGFKKFKARSEGRKEQYPQDSELHKIHWKKAIFYVKHIGYYFQIILFPFKPRMYHEYHFYFPRYQEDIDKAYKIDLDFARGAAVMAFLAFEMVVNHNFWAFWFILFISQHCGVYIVTMNVADRYCSLAAAGLMVMLAQKIALLPQPYDMFALGAFLACYAIGYNPLLAYTYKSWERFLLYHTHIQPDGSRQRMHLAQFYLKLKDPFQAFSMVKQGLKYRPKDFDLLLMMANISLMLGFPIETLKMVEHAEKRIPLKDEKDCIIELNRLKLTATHIINEQQRDSNNRAKQHAIAESNRSRLKASTR